MKRFTALLLVCAMVLCLLSVSVLAGTDVPSKEEKPNPTEPEKTSPQTGMDGSLMVVGFVMLASMCTAAIVVKKAR